MQCRQISAQIIAYLKGELAREEATRVTSHLAACPRCRDEARVLGNAFSEMARLPTFRVTYDIHAIEAGAWRQPPAAPIRQWWKLVPAVACAAVIVIMGFLVYHRISTTRIAQRPRLSPRSPAPAVAPRPKVPVRMGPDESDQPHIAMRRHEERQVVADNRRHAHRQVAPRQQRTAPRAERQHATPRGTVQHPPRQESVPPVDGDAVIAQYVDTLALCMTQSDNPRASISCSILPVATADERDLPVADSLTAALVCAFNDRHVTIDIKRLAPLATTADLQTLTPNAATLARLADTVTGDYVIAGHLKKAKAGYVLSLYAFDKQGQSMVFDGDHPILLPSSVIPRFSDIISHGMMRTIAIASAAKHRQQYRQSCS